MPRCRLSVLACAILLGACTAYPQRPAPPAFPDASTFDTALPSSVSTGATPWWRRAVDDGLGAWVDAGIAVNPVLRRLQAEVDAARARLDQAEADTGPEVTLGADAALQKTSGSDTTDSRSAAIDARVPLDINGALARRAEAARFAWQAGVEDVAQLRSDLARDLLLAAVDAAEAHQLGELLDAQQGVLEKLLALVELRFGLGLASSVDVLQQRDQLAALRQQLPAALLTREQALNRVRLAGNIPPGRPVGTDLIDVPAIDDHFPSSAPVELLERRALLRAARARLAAADARFAEALAARWPSLSLSGGVLQRVVSGDAGTLISAALDAAFSLFDSGAQRAVAAEQRALLAAAGEQYLAAWFEAALTADDQMREIVSLQRRIALSENRLETAQALLEATRRRYERGISDYLPVLEALRGLQQQQRDHLALQAGLARARLRLHHALGDPPDGDTI